MTYDASAWTGRREVPQWPRFAFELRLPWFAVRIGVHPYASAYGLEWSWGATPGHAYGPLFRRSRMWVWLTAEQVFSHG